MTLFPGKIRELPVTVTLTRRHHAKVRAAVARLKVTRSDFVALLIERYSDVVELPSTLPTPDDE